MKTKIPPPLFFFVFALIFNFINSIKAAEIPAIVRDWAAYAGHTDSAFKAPVASDTNYTYVASFTINSGTGADILLVKYDKDGIKQWEKVWTGPGAGRDQATGIVLTNDDIYICGFSYTSSVNDYDMVTLKYKKDGSFVWASTFNGPGSSYDGAAAIALNASGLYVAGVINNTTSSSLDYGLIRYDMSSGTQLWNVSYDYNQLMDIPFALTVSNDSIITITGGSQSSVYDWDYATLNYGPTDTLLSTNRVSGSSAGFDRALAVKSDANGNVYITGSSAQNSTGYDVKTVKILANGTLDWMKTQDGDGADDEGTDLIVDANGNVYVCGTIGFNGQKDIMVLKYDKHGVQQWSQYIDYSTGDDFGVKMCLDQYGNIIVTGSVKTNVYDIYTAGFKPEDGAKVWEDVYDAPYHGLDKAFDITSDANGYIYVTGTAEADTGFGTVTIKYRTDYYTEPGQIDTPAVSYLFYPNSGQIIDTDDKTNTVDYYTLHHYPQLYFNPGEMNMVWAHIDQDTATADTMQRVDVSFLGSSNPTKAFPLKEREDAGYLNYFLGHCPNGITQVYGNESLLFEGVYSGIDAIYSSNNAGLKLYFVCAAQSDPSNIGLKLEGQDNVQIVNNWGLEVQTVLGTYEFEKPRVYQLDGSGNRITLPWTLSWTMNASDEAKFTGWGNYDRDKTLVIEVGDFQNLACATTTPANIDWSTYLGGPDPSDDGIIESAVDNSGNYFVTGFVQSHGFPGTSGTVAQQNFHGGIDVFVSKFLTPSMVLEWSTYYGGSINSHPLHTADDIPRDIIIGSDNIIYVVGNTYSMNFPLPTTEIGYFQLYFGGESDIFILGLNQDGSRNWTTLFGGITDEKAFALRETNDHNLAITGTVSFQTSNPNTTTFPVRIGNNPCGVPNPTWGFNGGISLCQDNSSYFDDTHNGGEDILLLKFNIATKLLIWSTLIGGSGDDISSDLAIDPNNNEFVLTGTTNSIITSSNSTCNNPPSNGEFPLCNNSGYFQNNNLNVNIGEAFLFQFNNLNQLVWATYFGGIEDCNGDHVVINSTGDLYLLGRTKTANLSFPTTYCQANSIGSFPLCHSNASDYYQDDYDYGTATHIDRKIDLFVAKFDDARNLKWCTLYGGSGEDYNTNGSTRQIDINSDMTIDNSDRIYLCFTSSKSTTSINDIQLTQYGNYYYQNSNYAASNTKLRDQVLACFGKDNKLFWATNLGGDYNEFASTLTISNTDKKLYLAGCGENGNIQFPFGTTLSTNPWNQCPPNTNYDALITRFDLSGLHYSIDEINFANYSINIFPNPANKIISLSILGIRNTQLDYEILDLTGRIVQSGELIIDADGKTSLNLKLMAAGVYMFKFINDHEFFTSKFVLSND